MRRVPIAVPNTKSLRPSRVEKVLFTQRRAALSQGHRPSTVGSSSILRLALYYGAVVCNVDVHTAVHNRSHTVRLPALQLCCNAFLTVTVLSVTLFVGDPGVALLSTVLVSTLYSYVPKFAKSDRQVSHVCPSVRLYGTIRLPLERFL